MNQPLWAPWRMEYIRSEKPRGCIFCAFWEADPAQDQANLLVHRGVHAFTCLNRFPYNSGHVMVIPRAHGAELSELSPEVWTGLQDELRLAAKVVRAVYRPEGLNLGMNLGHIAGAGIADHLHWHIVPRWAGDNNFMPVLADTRVIVQALDDAWRRLSSAFGEGAAEP